MRYLSLALVMGVLSATSAFAETESTDEPTTYVPRVDQAGDSVFTFKGSGKGLSIRDNVTGEETVYTTKKTRPVKELPPEAMARAEEEREREKAEQEAREAEAKEEEKAAKEAEEEAAKEEEEKEEEKEEKDEEDEEANEDE